MNRPIRILFLFFIAGGVFAAGFFTARCLHHRRDGNLRRQMHPAMQTHIWPHPLLKGLSVFSRPIDDTSYLAELGLFRDQETVVIPREPNESWENFIVASKTNKMFSLVRTNQENDQFAFKKLVEITLPRTNQTLDSIELDILFTMDTLAMERGESWVGRIGGVTSDGSKLLLARAFPYSLSAHEIGWRYKNVIYDVYKNEFVGPVFETDSHILKQKRTSEQSPELHLLGR